MVDGEFKWVVWNTFRQRGCQWRQWTARWLERCLAAPAGGSSLTVVSSLTPGHACIQLSKARTQGADAGADLVEDSFGNDILPAGELRQARAVPGLVLRGRQVHRCDCSDAVDGWECTKTYLRENGGCQTRAAKSVHPKCGCCRRPNPFPPRPRHGAGRGAPLVWRPPTPPWAQAGAHPRVLGPWRRRFLKRTRGCEAFFWVWGRSQRQSMASEAAWAAQMGSSRGGRGWATLLGRTTGTRGGRCGGPKRKITAKLMRLKGARFTCLCRRFLVGCRGWILEP
jgi:hypothetical protein